MHVHRDHTAGPDTAYHARRSDALYQVPKWQGKMCPDANTKNVEAGSGNQGDTSGRGQGNEVGAADKFIGAHMLELAGQREAATENQILESGNKVTNKDRTYLRRVRAAAWFRASVAGESRCVLGSVHTAASLSFASRSPPPRSNSGSHFAINLQFHQS